MATRYARGRQFEYRVKRYYENKGWFVIRSAGSKGIADIVAISPDAIQIHFIQCKRAGYLSKSESKLIVETARRFGALPVLARTGKNSRSLELLSINVNGSEYVYKPINIDKYPAQEKDYE